MTLTKLAWLGLVAVSWLVVGFFAGSAATGIVAGLMSPFGIVISPTIAAIVGIGVAVLAVGRAVRRGDS